MRCIGIKFSKKTTINIFIFLKNFYPLVKRVTKRSGKN